jgi:hypothetical protein
MADSPRIFNQISCHGSFRSYVSYFPLPPVSSANLLNHLITSLFWRWFTSSSSSSSSSANLGPLVCSHLELMQNCESYRKLVDSLHGGWTHCKTSTCTGQHRHRKNTYTYASSGIWTHHPSVLADGDTLCILYRCNSSVEFRILSSAWDLMASILVCNLYNSLLIALYLWHLLSVGLWSTSFNAECKTSAISSSESVSLL